MTPDQAAAELRCIQAAREAVRLAAERIRLLAGLHDAGDSDLALSDAANAVMDAFEDSLGQTENDLRDAGKVE